MNEANAPGAGAAGGLGFAMLAFFNATLQPGFDIIADAVRLRERLRNANLCITGEGRLDASSFNGKAAVAIARLCSDLKVPCIAIAGQIDERNLPNEKDLFTDRRSISEGIFPAQSHDRAAELLSNAAGEALARFPSR